MFAIEQQYSGLYLGSVDELLPIVQCITGLKSKRRQIMPVLVLSGLMDGWIAWEAEERVAQ